MRASSPGVFAVLFGEIARSNTKIASRATSIGGTNSGSNVVISPCLKRHALRRGATRVRFTVPASICDTVVLESLHMSRDSVRVGYFFAVQRHTIYLHRAIVRWLRQTGGRCNGFS